jgi:hypothetical protein
MGELGRNPVTLLEVDLPYCNRAYGVTPCAAALGVTGAAKCFNGLATCQDRANYDEGVKTVTFAYNQDGNPDIPGIFPALQSVSSRPGELNLSGIDPQKSALGVRARVTARLQDFANNDTWLDKYQAERVSGAALLSGIGYDPEARGQFLARMFVRFPFYDGIPVRVRRGYEGQAPVDMDTEHYVLSELKGPNAAGVVDIVAKDVFDLAEDVIPAVSIGKLLSGIGSGDGLATLDPPGVGETYAASGLVRIGREIMFFTRSGDTLALSRGVEGTAPASHGAGDVVQECVALVNLSIPIAAEAILKYRTTAFDPFIPTAEWVEENDTWYAGLELGRVIISRPTVKKLLIGELCALGCMFWWDAIDQEIKFRINAPLLPGEEYYPVNDESGLIEGSVDVDRAEDQRISAIWMYHGVRDWTDDALASRNFNKLAIAAMSVNDYKVDALREVFTRWFGREGNDAAVSIITERLLARYEKTPKIVEGTLDVKDRAGVPLAARLLVETYALQDVDGAILAEPMQANYVKYSDDRVKFRAETYSIEGQFAFWLDEATAPVDWDSATPAQRETGAFWGDADNPDPESDYLYF